MEDTGWTNPGNVFNTPRAGGTGVAWVNPSNASSSDNTYTTNIQGGVTVSDYLEANNFGFSIPTGATIKGIEIRYELYHSGGTSDVEYYDIQVRKPDGVITSEAKSFDSIPDTEQYEAFGGAADLWGESSFTPAQINNSNFGLVLMVSGTGGMTTNTTVYVDNMQMKVYYETSSSGGSTYRQQLISVA